MSAKTDTHQDKSFLDAPSIEEAKSDSSACKVSALVSLRLLGFSHCQAQRDSRLERG